MHAQQFEKPNNFKVFGSKKTKDNNRKVIIGYGHLCLRSTHFSDGGLLVPREYHSPSSQCFGLLDIFVIEIYSMIYIYIYICNVW